MADRYPLIYNPNANQLQELQSGDSLDLGGSGISSVTNINASGVITATSFSGSGANLTGIAVTTDVRTNSLVVSGVSTLGNTVVGGGTTQLIVTGNARITGILTIGTGSITLDGSNNQVNVGTGVTLHHTNGVQVGGNNLHSTVLTVNQINASGIVTATGGFNLGISSAGTSITSGPVKTLNFIGTGNTFAVSGTTVDISIAGGSGSSGGSGESFNELDAALFN